MKKLTLLTLSLLTAFMTNTVMADSAKLTNPLNGHSYQRFDTPKTWSQAKDACASQGGYLATINFARGK